MTRRDYFFVYKITLGNLLKDEWSWNVSRLTFCGIIWKFYKYEIIAWRKFLCEPEDEISTEAKKTCGCDVVQYQWVFITSQISRLIGQDTEIKSFLTRRKISLPASTRCKANFSQFHAIEFGEGNQPCSDGKFVLMKLNVVYLKCRWLKYQLPAY